jgi:hypothetical protein
MADYSLQKSKGYTIKGALNFVDYRFGKDGIEKLRDSLSDDLKKEISKGIIPSDWYPFKFQVEIYEKIDKVFGSGSFEFCKEIGKYTAEYEVSTIHKLFFKIGSPDTILKFGSLLWGRYYNKGKLEIISEEKYSATAYVKDWHPISRAFCIDLFGWMEKTLQLAGASSVYIKHSECLLDGFPHCKYEGFWKPKS